MLLYGICYQRRTLFNGILRFDSMRLLCPPLSIHEIGMFFFSIRIRIQTNRHFSHIILALLGTGETYLVDLRKENRGQVELCEVQDESEDEGEAQVSRSRYVDCRITF
jgi:hypothetical protein